MEVPHGRQRGEGGEFIQQVRGKVTLGTSALFVLPSDAVIDKVADRFEGTQAEFCSSNPTKDQKQALLTASSED